MMRARLLVLGWALSAMWFGLRGEEAARLAGGVTVGHRGPVTGFAAEGGVLWSCSQAGVFRGGSDELRRVRLPAWRPIDLGLSRSADGERSLFVCGGDPGSSGMVARWLIDEDRWEEMRVGNDLVYGLAVSEQVLYAGLADGRLLRLPLDQFGKKDALSVLHRHSAAVRDVVLTPNGDHVLSVGLDRVVLISSAHHENGSALLAIQDHTDKLDCLTWLDDGALIASGARDGRVRLHDLKGRLVRTYPVLDGEISALAWMPGADGGRLVAGTPLGVVYELDPQKNEVRSQSEYSSGVAALCFVGAGGLLVGGDHGFREMK